MSANVDRLVTVFGGSGFIGRHTVRALARRGYRIRVAVRRPDLAFHLQPLGTVGQIHAVQANLRFPDSIARAADGADAVVNLVGILHESGRNSFEAVQSFGAAAIARAATGAGASSLIQVSAIGADANSDAAYARTKAAGEASVRGAFPDAIVLRPSIVFGPEDDFFNRFAAMARLAPALPLVGGGETKFQPVFVGDVAEAIARGVDGTLKSGATYELGGPEVKSFRELLEYVLKVTHRTRLLAPLPFPLASFMARFLQYIPNPPLTPDQVTMLKVDNVVSKAAIDAGLTLEGMGIEPTAMKAIVPTYLWRFRASGEFDKAAA